MAGVAETSPNAMLLTARRTVPSSATTAIRTAGRRSPCFTAFITAVVDASVVFSLAWALAVPGGMSSGLVWLVVSSVCAVIWVTRGGARVGGLGLLANRTGNLVTITVIAAFAAAHAANDPADGVGVVRRLFAGAYEDPIGYALIWA